MDPLIWQILLQVVLIFLNAVFASAEIAVISFNPNKLSQMAAKGNKRAKKLMKLFGINEKKLAVDTQLEEAVKEKDSLRETLTGIQDAIADLNSKIEGNKNEIIQSLNERATIKSRLERIDTLAEYPLFYIQLFLKRSVAVLTTHPEHASSQ